MVRWVDPFSYFSFQPVLHDRPCKKGRGMCYPVCECLLDASRETLVGITCALKGFDPKPSVHRFSTLSLTWCTLTWIDWFEVAILLFLVRVLNLTLRPASVNLLHTRSLLHPEARSRSLNLNIIRKWRSHYVRFWIKPEIKQFIFHSLLFIFPPMDEPQVKICHMMLWNQWRI